MVIGVIIVLIKNYVKIMIVKYVLKNLLLHKINQYIRVIKI